MMRLSRVVRAAGHATSERRLHIGRTLAKSCSLLTSNVGSLQSSPRLMVRSLSSQPPPNMQLPQWMRNDQPQSGDHLKQFTVDLTELARQQKLDNVVGRETETRRCLQILARRTKNNPILIGAAGVGKTAIAEALALRIQSGQVPESMKNKRVLSLDVSALMAGASMRGQFEERLKGVLKDVEDAKGEIILFLDEIHTMVTAGKGEGSMDMGNMLKPALARGDLQLVGATTLDEYRIIEKDAALARRFQSVYVKEPNVEDTISILRGIKTAYELHHNVTIQDQALVAAATLSDRYIMDRQQPDKSIDLVDEACSRLRLEQESKPEVVWQLEQELMTRQIELSALENEATKDSKQISRREEVEAMVMELKGKVRELTDEWMAEKEGLSRVQDVKEELEQAKMDMEAARRAGDFGKAGEFLHATIPNLEDQLERLEQAIEGDNSKKMLAEAVTADAIADLISRHTGIPVSRISGNEEEAKKLLNMEASLRGRVVGQDHVLQSISDCVRLARTRLQARDRTLGNFLFLGPTGVGKTETAKALAEYIFDDQNAMTRIDMSEYGEKHTVSRLIGAPPGYVGYEEGGTLTESIRRRPYQVLLLDEFEKAHKGVWNLLLQLFDEGRLTDSHGRTVDFRNVIVIMTSNLGAHIISELSADLKGSEPHVQDQIMEVVRHTLSPELLNRIDDSIVFNRLQRDDMGAIAEIGIQEIADRLEDGQNMSLDVSPAAKSVIAEMGYDVRYGARPLKRTMAKVLLNPMSRMVLEGGIKEGDTVRVRTRGEAEKLAGDLAGWISSNENSDNRNDVVILRNHATAEASDDEPELLEDKTA